MVPVFTEKIFLLFGRSISEQDPVHPLRVVFPKGRIQATHRGRPKVVDSHPKNDGFCLHAETPCLARLEDGKFNAPFSPKLTFKRLRVNVSMDRPDAQTAGTETLSWLVEEEGENLPVTGGPVPFKLLSEN